MQRSSLKFPNFLLLGQCKSSVHIIRFKATHLSLRDVLTAVYCRLPLPHLTSNGDEERFLDSRDEGKNIGKALPLTDTELLEKQDVWLSG